MNIKPLATTAKEGYVKQKQNEARNRADIDIKVDERQLEREIDSVLCRVVKKMNGK